MTVMRALIINIQTPIDNSDGYSKYPTNDKLYECQKGPLEGFFTSSVEFCIAANSNTK